MTDDGEYNVTGAIVGAIVCLALAALVVGALAVLARTDAKIAAEARRAQQELCSAHCIADERAVLVCSSNCTEKEEERP